MDHVFHQLIQRKKRLLVFPLIFLFVFYFGLPLVLALFPDVMNRQTVFLHLSWGWLYAFAQIPMTWFLGWIYFRKAGEWDKLVNRVKREGKK